MWALTLWNSSKFFSSKFSPVKILRHTVVCEQTVICKVTTLPLALFITFSTFYCFNLEYPAKARNIFYFLQDYICEIADTTKRSGNYHAIASDIKRKLLSENLDNYC